MQNNWNQGQSHGYSGPYTGYQLPVGGQPPNIQYIPPLTEGTSHHHQIPADPSLAHTPGQYTSIYYPTQPISPPYPPTTQVIPTPNDAETGDMSYRNDTDSNIQWPGLYQNSSMGVAMVYQSGTVVPTSRPSRAQSPQPIPRQPSVTGGVYTSHPAGVNAPLPFQTQDLTQQHTHYHHPLHQHGEHSPNSSTSTATPPNLQTYHPCLYCPYQSLRRADVRRHIRSIHTGENACFCDGCGEGFVRTDARGRHWLADPACAAKHTANQSNIPKRTGDM